MSSISVQEGQPLPPEVGQRRSAVPSPQIEIKPGERQRGGGEAETGTSIEVANNLGAQRFFHAGTLAQAGMAGATKKGAHPRAKLLLLRL